MTYLSDEYKDEASVLPRIICFMEETYQNEK